MTTTHRRGPRPAQKLPYEPFARCFEEGTWDRHIGELLGLTRTALQAYKSRGIPVYKADRWAITIGLHPAVIWGDLWWDLALEDDAAA